MLETLKPTPPDKIIELLGLFRADPRSDKLDLGVGVYKDADGRTPVMRSVKAAEARLLKEQDSKAYVGLLGDLDFLRAMGDLALGGSVPQDRLSGAQTPGGTGAIRQLFELIRRANPGATVWISEPTWPNHPAILGHLGIPVRSYRYFDVATRGVDFAGMMADLVELKAGDVLLLHGCCHNPTGANLGLEQWRELTAFVIARGRCR
jgi:aromatic-amino-acid transaminase